MGLEFVDLFCGIGTIRMGMEEAGHTCVYSVEWDKHKRQIYKIIFGGEPEGADIREVRAGDIPRADMWCFGAPCQDFSIAGKRAGLEGDRSSLISEVFRLIRETPEEYRPKYILYENVKGMLSSNKGFDYLEILHQMDALGYDAEWELLNSKNFGVPQNRERVFTLGHLRGRGSRKVFPITGDNGEVTTKLQELTQGTSDALRVYDPEGLGRTLKAEGGGWGAKMGLYFIDLSTQEAKVTDHARCLQARYNKGYSHHKGEVSGVIDMQDFRIRKLTPKECWRLQGVLDEITDKVICAGVSDTQMYRGAGDACTTKVILEIGKKLT